MENVTLTNMCMVYDGDGNILVQDKVDPDWGGVCFPGGHVEKGENFAQSVIREVWEETGLTIKNPVLCGIKHWPHKGGRYIVLYYKTDSFDGEIKSSDEGEVFFIKRSELDNYKLASGFKEMLRVFESDSLSENYFTTEDGNWILHTQ